MISHQTQVQIPVSSHSVFGSDLEQEDRPGINGASKLLTLHLNWEREAEEGQ